MLKNTYLSVTLLLLDTAKRQMPEKTAFPVYRLKFNTCNLKVKINFLTCKEINPSLALNKVRPETHAVPSGIFNRSVSCLEFLDRLDQSWHHLKQISYDAVISRFEEWCLRVLVDNDDHPRIVDTCQMLDSS